MKSRIAGLLLLMGTSLAAHAHHTGHTFDPPAGQKSSSATFAGRVSPAAGRASAAANDPCMTPGGGTGGSSGGVPPPIPEPGTYAMLLAGLGLMTGIARRRRLGG